MTNSDAPTWQEELADFWRLAEEFPEIMLKEKIKENALLEIKMKVEVLASFTEVGKEIQTKLRENNQKQETFSQRFSEYTDRQKREGQTSKNMEEGINLRTANNAILKERLISIVEDLCNRYNLSRDFLDDARRLHQGINAAPIRKEINQSAKVSRGIAPGLGGSK